MIILVDIFLNCSLLSMEKGLYLMIWMHIYISSTFDLFQPKTVTFSTRALIWANFKTVHYFSQPSFSLFSYLKNAYHNLVIELCLAQFFFKNIAQFFIKSAHSFVAIELLTFCTNAKKLFYCSRELSVFRT